MNATHFLIHLTLPTALEDNLKQSLVGHKDGFFEMKLIPL